jgi:hypothetical protein
MSFPWEARIPVSPGRRQTEMKDKVVGLGRAQKGCDDILGKEGEGRDWRQDTQMRD